MDAPLAWTPANLVVKVIFGKLVPKPKLYTKFELLASTVAEIDRRGGALKRRVIEMTGNGNVE